MGAKGLRENTISPIRSRICRLATAHRGSGPHRRTSSRVGYKLGNNTFRLLKTPGWPSGSHSSSTSIPTRDEFPKIFDLASLKTDSLLGHRHSPMEIPLYNQEQSRPLRVEEPLPPRLYRTHLRMWFTLTGPEILQRILRLRLLSFQSNYHIQASGVHRKSMMTCSAGAHWIIW
jgi:hypothetical protein